MRFKTLKILIVSLAITACNHESQPLHKQRVGEEQRTASESEARAFFESDSELLRLEHLIEKGSLDDQVSALHAIEDVLYSDESSNPDFYSKPRYRAYLLLKVRLIKKWKEHQSPQTDVSLARALQRFNTHFLEGCLGENESSCPLIQAVLKKESSSAFLVVQLAKEKSDLTNKLSYLGLAFDISNKRENAELVKEYIFTISQYANSLEENNNQPLLSQHIFNIKNLLEITNWTEVSLESSELFLLFAPWKYQAEHKTVENIFRKQLLAKIPIYHAADKRVQVLVQSELQDTKKRMLKNTQDLSQYPAYAGVNIDSIQEGLLDFLILKSFSGEFDITDLNDFYVEIKREHKNLDKIYDGFRQLLRWKVAELGVVSTQKISTAFAKEKVKTSTFVQKVIDDSTPLVAMWNHFHSVQKGGVNTFLESHKSDFKKYDSRDIERLMKTIDRNIYRTVIYPNMLAFSYYMAKSQWTATMRVWIWEIEVDTNQLFDYMLTGHYPVPWFTFADMSKLKSVSAQIADLNQDDFRYRKTLLRSEMLDSIYYFYTTKTHEYYGIDSDDFVKIMAEKLTVFRAPFVEGVINNQELLYHSDNPVVHGFTKWCRNTDAGIPTRETIGFGDIFYNNVPFLAELMNSKENSWQSLYYVDLYPSVESVIDRNMEVLNDRFRLEYLPVLSFLDHVWSIGKNAQSSHKGLIKTQWTETERYLSYLEKLKKAYLGSQMAARRMVDDCQFTAAKEALRRTKAAASAEQLFQEKVVFPLLKSVSKGDLAAKDANDLLRSFHQGTELYQDSIQASAGGQVRYMVDRLTVAWRMREFLINGLHVNHPIIGKVDVEAIVGDNLKIPIPPQILKRAKAPLYYWNYPHKNRKSFGLTDKTSSEKFAQTVVSALFAGTNLTRERDSDAFVEWLRKSYPTFVNMPQQHLSFFATFLQMGEFEHLDFTKPECRDYLGDIKKECLTTSQVTLEEASSHLNKWLSLMEIDEEEHEFLELIGETSLLDDHYLDFLLLFDSNLPFEGELSRSGLAFREMRGFHDMLYDMVKADYLGQNLFNTSSEINVAVADENGGGAPQTCFHRRDECYWANERSVARELHFARTEQGGMLFNFDKRILQRDFAEVRKRVQKKFAILRAIDKNGERQIKKVRQDAGLTVQVSLSKPQYKLKSLSPANQLTEDDFNQFFRLDTRSFYLNEPSWDSYLDPNISWWQPAHE